MALNKQLRSITMRRLLKHLGIVSSITSIQAFDLANNDALLAENAAGTANVDLIKLSTIDTPTVPTGLWAASGYKIGNIGAVTTKTTAGPVTYTAAEILTGTILRDPNGAGRSDVFPTAALMIAAVTGTAVGVTFHVHIRNTADNNETITMTAGVGGPTISGTATIAQNKCKTFRIVFTSTTLSSEAYTVYSLGERTF